ncbi:unnamed protein product [Bursaphelenchus xylophilus]|uniref:(pine wood nematode) hypothetical protein n=1 Tax=Bursaphelenchus xylophilus TaxID=6326 RepID=A0A1I7S1T5_BURXY|nr:unnamed protein product [Bursaphelenchus xylophilus]CAG9089929.1 unnamed protein product [Bursaphelenchus xylophilus]
MIAPLEVGFYTEIIGFLQCIKLEDSFQGTKPNGFEIITHDHVPHVGLVNIIEYRYNSFSKNVTRRLLDLVDKDGPAYHSYRVLLNQVGEEVKVGVTGLNGGLLVCAIFNKQEKNCWNRLTVFSELLGSSMAIIGCTVKESRMNVLYSPTGDNATSYYPETKDNFYCNIGLGRHKWDASPCQPVEYKLTSSGRLLLSLNYLIARFETPNCNRPTQLSPQFLDNTYVEFICNKTTEPTVSKSSHSNSPAIFILTSICGLLIGRVLGN